VTDYGTWYQSDPQWHRALPWAKLAHNNSVHSSLSHKGAALTPAEVHLGRKMHLQLEAALGSSGSIEGKRAPAEYARHVKAHLAEVQKWIEQCRLEYNKKMENSAAKQHPRAVHQWQKGDLVRLERPASRIHSKREKLRHEYDGPYEIVKQDEDTNRYTIKKVGEGHKEVKGVAADRIVKYYNELELDTRHAQKHAELPLNSDDKENIYEVEKIVHDRGSLKAGTKQYRVKWKGWEGHPHEYTWEPVRNLLHCADTIQAYEMTKDKLHESVFSVHEQYGKHCTITMDLNGEEDPEEVIKKICEEAKIQEEDIVLVWASPPCSTFSRANWTNLSRGNHYRNKDLSPVQGQKGNVAKQHDQLVDKVKKILNKFEHTVMENPAVGLERMPYMLDQGRPWRADGAKNENEANSTQKQAERPGSNPPTPPKQPKQNHQQRDRPTEAGGVR